MQDPEGFYHDTQAHLEPIQYEPQREVPYPVKVMSYFFAFLLVAGACILAVVALLAAIIWVVGVMV